MTRRVGSIELQILDFNNFSNRANVSSDSRNLQFARAGPLQVAPPPTTKPQFSQPLQPSSSVQAGQHESPVSHFGICRQPISSAAKSLPFSARVSRTPSVAVRTAIGSQPLIPQPILEETRPTLSITSLDRGHGETGGSI